ncbi:DUF4136 domain-containing protein [Orrella sp. JC864]|uniref:DUF4136 domain-containing protein n=1 Tax=Orrella sp. JC864 TaxID=3120298 RepID=UPI0012BB9C8C
MNFRKPMLALAATAALAGCATGPALRSDYDPAADFSRYRTYAYVQPLGTDKAGYSSLLTERLKSATRTQMEMRGYTYSEKSPDLLVNFGARVDTRTEVVPAPPMPYYGYRMGFYGPWAGWGWGNEVYQYQEGTINIDLVDARRKQMVWEGVAVSRVRNAEQLNSETAVAQLVSAIFSRYPFVAGSGQPLSPHGPSQPGAAGPAASPSSAR